MVEINLVYLLNWTVYGWFFGLGIFIAILIFLLVVDFVKKFSKPSIVSSPLALGDLEYSLKLAEFLESDNPFALSKDWRKDASKEIRKLHSMVLSLERREKVE